MRFLWLPSTRGQFRSVMVARRRHGPEDGWRGGALHYCPPKLFDGCVLVMKILRERARDRSDCIAARSPNGGSERAEALPSTSSRLSLHRGRPQSALMEYGVNVGNRQVASRHILAARGCQARRCEASAWMSCRPSSWSKISTIVERPGQPVAASCAVATLASKARLRMEL